MINNMTRLPQASADVIAERPEFSVLGIGWLAIRSRERLSPSISLTNTASVTDLPSHVPSHPLQPILLRVRSLTQVLAGYGNAT